MVEQEELKSLLLEQVKLKEEQEGLKFLLVPLMLV